MFFYIKEKIATHIHTQKKKIPIKPNIVTITLHAEHTTLNL